MKRRKVKIEMFKRILKYILGGIVFVGIVFAVALYISIYNPGSLTKGAGSEDDGSKASISATGDATYFNYSDNGVLVYTSALNTARGDATVQSGDNIAYTLTMTNPHWDKKAINLKFAIPKNFSYQGGVTCQNISPCPDPSQVVGTTGIADLTWPAVNVPAGESSVSFKIKAP